MIKDYFKIALNSLFKRKLRSWLTMLGIFIGIASVVALISLGQGMQRAIDKQFEMLGTDKIIITPKGSMGAPGIGESAVELTKDDVDAIKKVVGVEQAYGYYTKTVKVEFNDVVKYYLAFGLPEDSESVKLYKSMVTVGIAGRDIKKGDKYKVVLGYDFANKKLMKRNINIGDKIKLNDQDFRVIGIQGQIGNPQDDSNVILPESTIRELYNEDEKVAMIFVKTAKDADTLKIAEDVKRALRNYRELDKGKEDFDIMTSDQIMEVYGQVLLIIQVVLVGIAAISLIVGGIGIMNTMYTAVIERTNEIGIMKAIGARNSDVLGIFLIESGLLGVVGGIIGIAIGMGLSKTVEIIAKQAWGTPLVQAYFPLYLIIGAILFSFIVGAVSGVLPAYQASKLKPVDALRYE